MLITISLCLFLYYTRTPSPVHCFESNCLCHIILCKQAIVDKEKNLVFILSMFQGARQVMREYSYP